MAGILERKLSQEVMLGQIEQVLGRGKPADAPAYTLILGAGASYGSIPTAKQMLGIADRGAIDPLCIPAFLRELEAGSPPRNEDLAAVVRSFWQKFIKANPDLTRDQSVDGVRQSLLEIEDGVPSPRSISFAYKALFDQMRTSGINTAAGARAYLRSITMRNSRQIRLNGTHFFLASLLSLQTHCDSQETWERGLYIGKRPFVRTIFTTNFDPLLQISLQLFQLLYYMTDRPDHLTADALQTDDHPAFHLFYAHGSVHRPFLANTGSEIGFLREKNAQGLATYFGQHGVIVLGYSGWDDCLLKGLNQTSSFAHNLYWLARGEASLSPEVKEFLLGHPNAFWVEIQDGGQWMSALHRRICPSMHFTELLKNPIPFLRRRLEQVDLTNIPAEQSSGEIVEADSSDTGEEIITAEAEIEQSTSPEQFRVQVVDLLRESERQFDKLSDDGSGNMRLKQYEHQADIAFGSRDWDKAIELYGRIAVSGLAPVALKAKALIRRGYAHDENGDQIKAIADYTEIIGLPGVDPILREEAYLNRGGCFEYLNKIPEAIADNSHVVESAVCNPVQRTRALIKRGDCYETINRMPEAVADFTRATENPGALPVQVSRAFFGLAHLYQLQKNYTEAIANYSLASDVPNAPIEQLANALVYRGIAYIESKMIEPAIADFTRVIEIPGSPQNLVSKALINRGKVYARLEKNSEAIADFTGVLACTNQSASRTARALLHRGQVYLQMNKVSDAVDDFTRTLSLKGARNEEIKRAEKALEKAKRIGAGRA